MIVKLIIDGGDMKPGPAIAQQLGPLGINIGKVISDVNQATTGFKGMKVPVEIDVNAKTKNFNIKVSSPPVAELIKKELQVEKGSGQAGAIKVGNISIEQVIKIAKMKSENMLAKDLKKAVRMVVGTCTSLGVLIDNKEAKEVESEIASGHYDKEISSELTELSKEKKEKLDKFFAVRKAKQDKDIKALEEAKAAEEAAKAAAVAAQPAAAATQTSAAAPSAQKETAPAKKEEKKEAKKK